jgi:hypothetical protein
MCRTDDTQDTSDESGIWMMPLSLAWWHEILTSAPLQSTFLHVTLPHFQCHEMTLDGAFWGDVSQHQHCCRQEFHILHSKNQKCKLGKQKSWHVRCPKGGCWYLPRHCGVLLCSSQISVKDQVNFHCSLNWLWWGPCSYLHSHLLPTKMKTFHDDSTAVPMWVLLMPF